MNEYTIELKKIDKRRSLVLWVTPGGHKKFVVCSYYDPEKPVGSQWCWGHYFEGLDSAIAYIKGEEAPRYYITKDGKIEARTATIDAAIDLIKTYQEVEQKEYIRAEFSIIKGTEEFIKYEEA